MSSHALVWFRRDLRDFDHAALYHALAIHFRGLRFRLRHRDLDAPPPGRSGGWSSSIASVVDLDGAPARRRRSDRPPRRRRGTFPPRSVRWGDGGVRQPGLSPPPSPATTTWPAPAGAGHRLCESFKDQVIFERARCSPRRHAVFGVHAPQAGLAGGAHRFPPQGLSGRQIRASLAPPAGARPHRAGRHRLRADQPAELGITPGMAGVGAD